MPPRVLRGPLKRIVIFSLIGLLLIAAGFGLHTWRAVHLALSAGRQVAAWSGRVKVSIRTLRPSSSAFEPVLTAADFRSAAQFGGDLYICSSSALFRYREGELRRVWHAGRELPAYPLTSVSVRTGVGNPELWIATNGAGVVVYDGNTFRQMLPEDPPLRKVAAMLPLRNGQVLVGTSTAGLYLSDGKSLRIFHPQFAKTQVTALAGDEDQIWIGTRADGAWRWSGGEAVHLTAELPDPQVLSIAAHGEKAWIGTPLGVVEFSGGRLNRRLAEGAFAQALAERDGTLWIGTVDQGIIAVALAIRRPRPQLATRIEQAENITAFAQ